MIPVSRLSYLYFSFLVLFVGNVVIIKTYSVPRKARAFRSVESSVGAMGTVSTAAACVTSA